MAQLYGETADQIIQLTKQAQNDQQSKAYNGVQIPVNGESSFTFGLLTEE